MKRFKLMAFIGLIAIATLSLQSCNDDDDYDYSASIPNAIVTVKTDATGNTYLQLDDKTELWPVNITKQLYDGKEVRAFVNFRLATKEEASQGGSMVPEMRNVYVNWIDSIRTKPMAEPLGADNDKVYGNDPLEIINDWTTVCEDGYLTLHFYTVFGNGKPHIMNLVKSDDEGVVELHHNAQGDTRGNYANGIIAFRLTGLPDTEGEYKDMKLRWRAFTGVKEVTFKYRSRQ